MADGKHADSQPSRLKTSQPPREKLIILIVSRISSHDGWKRLTAVHDDYYSPETNTIPLPGNGKSLRSPGIRFGEGGSTPPIFEDAASPPGDYGQNFPSRTGGGGNTGGVKRTKSLMQKIKTMVRTRSGSVEGASSHMPHVTSGHYRPGLSAGQRSQSMTANLGYTRPAPATSPGWMNRELTEEENMVDEDEEYRDAREDVFAAGKARSQSVYVGGRR